MKPRIGIIVRYSKSETGKKIIYAYEDIIKSITKSGGIPIIIPNDDIYPYLDICQGFIFQGGSHIDKHNFCILKILKERNIPTLGICLGMQEMSLNEGGKLIDIPNHYHNKLHEITISENSLLYKIMNTRKTLVNSRHHSSVKSTNLKITSYSNDNIVESVEDSNNKFFLGVQWHPENMFDTDINSRKLFAYFIKMCHN